MKHQQLNQNEEAHILQVGYPDLPKKKGTQWHIRCGRCGKTPDELYQCIDHSCFYRDKNGDNIFSKDDISPLFNSREMYSKEESREFELERENERLKVVVDMQQFEIETLKKQLFGSLPGLNDKNNY